MAVILRPVGKEAQAQAHLPLRGPETGRSPSPEAAEGSACTCSNHCRSASLETHRRGQQCRQGGRAAGAAPPARRRESRPVAVKQLVQHVLLQIHVFLRPDPGGMDGHPQGGALEKAVDLGVQLVLRNGLEQVIHRAGLHGFPDEGIIVEAADEDHVALQLLLVQASAAAPARPSRAF